MLVLGLDDWRRCHATYVKPHSVTARTPDGQSQAGGMISCSEPWRQSLFSVLLYSEVPFQSAPQRPIGLICRTRQSWEPFVALTAQVDRGGSFTRIDHTALQIEGAFPPGLLERDVVSRSTPIVPSDTVVLSVVMGDLGTPRQTASDSSLCDRPSRVTGPACEKGCLTFRALILGAQRPSG